MRSLLFALLFAAAICVPLTGCGPSASTKKTANGHGHDHDHDHGHSHDHDHSHAHGLHDGHVMELGDEEYHAEWTHDDASGKVTIYILDKEIKKVVPIAAEKLVINTTVKSEDGDKEKTYELEAVNPTDGKTAQFETTDKTLLTLLLGVGEGIAATLEVPVEGKIYVQKFQPEDHSGHKH